MEIVKLKAPANIVYELSNTGNIKAKEVMKVLYSQPEVKKKMNSVVESIENCLWNNHPIVSAKYDMLLNEIILEISDEEYHWCPRCKKEFTGYPAISRTDNITEICSDCGTEEAFEAMFSGEVKRTW